MFVSDFPHQMVSSVETGSVDWLVILVGVDVHTVIMHVAGRHLAHVY